MEIKARELGKINQQRNVFQKKEHAKTLKELSEVEIDNLVDKEFIVMILKIIKECRKRMNAQRRS